MVFRQVPGRYNTPRQTSRHDLDHNTRAEWLTTHLACTASKIGLVPPVDRLGEVGVVAPAPLARLPARTEALDASTGSARRIFR
jgi:hypothetical protein